MQKGKSKALRLLVPIAEEVGDVGGAVVVLIDNSPLLRGQRLGVEKRGDEIVVEDKPPSARAGAAVGAHVVACFALSRRHARVELSMGMSADFEVAVEEGATIVRIGTAILGARPTT